MSFFKKIIDYFKELPTPIDSTFDRRKSIKTDTTTTSIDPTYEEKDKNEKESGKT